MVAFRSRLENRNLDDYTVEAIDKLGFEMGFRFMDSTNRRKVISRMIEHFTSGALPVEWDVDETEWHTNPTAVPGMVL